MWDFIFVAVGAGLIGMGLGIWIGWRLAAMGTAEILRTIDDRLQVTLKKAKDRNNGT